MKTTRKITCAILAASSLVMSAQQPGTAPQTTPSSPQMQPSTPASSVAAGTASAAPTSPQMSKSATEQTVPAALALTGSGNASSAVDNTHYIIGAEDALQITVWREPTLSGTFPVRPDGMVSMVLLGDVPAAGKTPTQLSNEIGERLHKYVQDPSVTVQVMAVNSQKIYLIGEVGHVGAIPLSADMSPLKAIASAGGLSPFANAKHIYILRGSGATQQKIPFNYKQALKGDDRQQVVLHPGDTIVVP